MATHSNRDGAAHAVRTSSRPSGVYYRRPVDQMSLFWHEDQRNGHARILWLKAWLEAVNAGRAFTWTN